MTCKVCEEEKGLIVEMIKVVSIHDTYDQNGEHIQTEEEIYTCPVCNNHTSIDEDDDDTDIKYENYFIC